METGKKLAVYSTVLNVVLVGAKGGLAVLTGSTALLAEMIHSLTDVIGSITVLVGITISRKKSPSFPWGLYKVENIAAIISAFFIFLLAYEIGKSTLFSEAKEIRNINISILSLAVMTIPIILFARYEKKKALELNSPSLLADAKNWMTDVAPIGVVIGGLAGSVVYPHSDKIASIIVIVFIVRAGYDIVRDSLKSLLDASVDSVTIERMKEIVYNFGAVKTINSLIARNSGSFIFAHLNITLSVKKLKEAHHIANDIEEAIRKEIPFMERIIIHYEPEKKDFLRYAVPLNNKEGEISEHFGGAPFIAIWDERFQNGSKIAQDVIQNPFLEMEKGKGIKLAELLVDRGIDVIYVKDDFEGKGPSYVFSDADIPIRKTGVIALQELKELKKESF